MIRTSGFYPTSVIDACGTSISSFGDGRSPHRRWSLMTSASNKPIVPAVGSFLTLQMAPCVFEPGLSSLNLSPTYHLRVILRDLLGTDRHERFDNLRAIAICIAATRRSCRGICPRLVNVGGKVFGEGVIVIDAHTLEILVAIFRCGNGMPLCVKWSLGCRICRR